MCFEVADVVHFLLRIGFTQTPHSLWKGLARTCVLRPSGALRGIGRQADEEHAIFLLRCDGGCHRQATVRLNAEPTDIYKTIGM